MDAPYRGVTGVRRALIYLGTLLFNPITGRVGGSREFMPLALVRHRGRTSGREYATPVGVRPTSDGFVIPLTFGEQADWIRNVRAAGGCGIRWRGREYPVVEPELVEWSVARAAFSPFERLLVPRLGITRFVRLRHAPANTSERDEQPAAERPATLDGATASR
ncbi:MAG TPA: nitroreductase/quinone reductase family protein [Ktedonobacterales bacterium]|nr:nitroreductase/quinone reductase family protein [Ktedonobacterales bacterium]